MEGPVLSRTINQEEIKVSVLRLSVLEKNGEMDESNEGPTLQFICDLYPDAIGIQSVSLKDRKDISKRTLILPKGYEGPSFQ